MLLQQNIAFYWEKYRDIMFNQDVTKYVPIFLGWIFYNAISNTIRNMLIVNDELGIVLKNYAPNYY